MSSFQISKTPSSILIFGATGKIGLHLTEWILKASPRFSRVSIFTSPSTVAAKAELLFKWETAGASIIIGDLTNPQDIADAYRGVDTVVSAVGRNVIQKQIQLIRLAEESSSVQWFFPSEYGTDVEHGPKSASERPHQDKLAVRKFIRDEVRRLHVVYLVTGPFFDMWAKFLHDQNRKEVQIIGDGEGKIGFCTMPDVGKFLVAALQNPPALTPKALRVQSFITTPNRVLEEFQKQTQTKWNVTPAPLVEFRAMEEKMWERKDPIATPMTLLRIWAEGGTLYDRNDNELLGLEAKDLDSMEVAVERVLTVPVKL
ncbi:hypothetical protein MCOR06_004292 [Pyricularia oryzae]|nr:hypothetical protein MCOR06_004292 [Pyricularia oryzae]